MPITLLFQIFGLFTKMTYESLFPDGSSVLKVGLLSFVKHPIQPIHLRQNMLVQQFDCRGQSSIMRKIWQRAPVHCCRYGHRLRNLGRKKFRLVKVCTDIGQMCLATSTMAWDNGLPAPDADYIDAGFTVLEMFAPNRSGNRLGFVDVPVTLIQLSCKVDEAMQPRYRLDSIFPPSRNR